MKQSGTATISSSCLDLLSVIAHIMDICPYAEQEKCPEMASVMKGLSFMRFYVKGLYFKYAAMTRARRMQFEEAQIGTAFAVQTFQGQLFTKVDCFACGTHALRGAVQQLYDTSVLAARRFQTQSDEAGRGEKESVAV